MRKINIFRKIINLLRLIANHQKVKFYLVGLLVVFTSSVEVLSVYLVIPTYKSLIEKVPISETIPIFLQIFKLSFNSMIQEQLFVLFIFAITFTFANFLKGLIIWQSAMQTADISV